MTAADERSGDPDGRPPRGELVTKRGSHLARNVAIAVGIVLIVLIVVLATRSTDERIENNAVGRAVPPVEGETLDGGYFDIDRYRGDWVVVNFFAQWCIPCQQEHPELVAFDEEHSAADDGVHLVSVVYSDQPDDVREFFEQRGGDWPVVTGETTGRIALDLGVTGVPETYVVAPDGTVVQKLVGAEGVTQGGLNAVIDRYEQAAEDAAAGGSAG